MQLLADMSRLNHISYITGFDLISHAKRRRKLCKPDIAKALISREWKRLRTNYVRKYFAFSKNPVEQKLNRKVFVVCLYTTLHMLTLLMTCIVVKCIHIINLVNNCQWTEDQEGEIPPPFNCLLPYFMFFPKSHQSLLAPNFCNWQPPTPTRTCPVVPTPPCVQYNVIEWIGCECWLVM